MQKNGENVVILFFSLAAHIFRRPSVPVRYIIFSGAFSAVNFARILWKLQTNHYVIFKSLSQFSTLLVNNSNIFPAVMSILCTVYWISSFCVVFTFQFGSVHIYCHFSSRQASNVMTQSQHQIAYFNFSLKFTIIFLWPLYSHFTIPLSHKIYVNKTIWTFISALLSSITVNVEYTRSIFCILCSVCTYIIIIIIKFSFNSVSVPLLCFMSMHFTSQKIISW